MPLGLFLLRIKLTLVVLTVIVREDAKPYQDCVVEIELTKAQKSGPNITLFTRKQILV